MPDARRLIVLAADASGLLPRLGPDASDVVVVAPGESLPDAPAGDAPTAWLLLSGPLDAGAVAAAAEQSPRAGARPAIDLAEPPPAEALAALSAYGAGEVAWVGDQPILVLDAGAAPPADVVTPLLGALASGAAAPVACDERHAVEVGSLTRRLETEREERSAAADQAREDLETARREERAAKRERAELKERLEAIEGSSAYRVARPLGAMFGRLPGGRAGALAGGVAGLVVLVGLVLLAAYAGRVGLALVVVLTLATAAATLVVLARQARGLERATRAHDDLHTEVLESLRTLRRDQRKSAKSVQLLADASAAASEQLAMIDTQVNDARQALAEVAGEVRASRPGAAS